MTACPICRTEATAKREATPYWICPTCDCWFQDPLPEKVYAGAHEPDPESMPEGERQINRDLARGLFDNVMHGKPGLTLDVGAKLPVLAAALKDLGCTAYAMDGDMRVNGYATELGVIPLWADFETFEAGELRFDLVTFIHCFEHVYDPLAVLRKLRGMIAEDGALFIRLPDHRVPGIERDLTPGHFTIHPYVHTLSSILQALAETGDTFVVAEDSPLMPGQRDLVLRRISRPQRIGLGMIVKNEERDLPRLLASVDAIAEQTKIVDTGSSDRTPKIAKAFGAEVIDFTDASRLVDGDWKLQNFARARNRFVVALEATSATHLLWMDADDELMHPQAIRRAAYYHAADVFGVWIQDGGTRWIQHRMWKTGKGVRFEGACHEYPVLDGLKQFTLDDCTIRHHSEPAAGQEGSNERNLRILAAEYAEKPSARTAFYIANTHKDAGRYAEAVEWYQTRIDYGNGHLHEWLFAHLYGARCARLAGDIGTAEAWLAAAIEAAPDWAEFHVEQAFVAYHQGQYEKAISILIPLRYPALCKIPLTHLWREPTMYRDQPLRIISWCYEHLGKMRPALAYAEAAQLEIDAPDQEWAARIARLRAHGEPKSAPASKINAIALHRPGAIGDILMTLNLIPALKEANPGMAVHYFCDARLGAMDALGSTMHAAGVDVIMDCAQWGAWESRYERAVNLVGYPLAEGYPATPMRKHLIEYFAHEMGLPPRGLSSLTLRKPARPSDAPEGDYATLQTRAGWSKYKNFGRWGEVQQIGGLDIPLVLIDENQGRTLAHSIALVANARMHLGIDSFCNHLTNFYWQDGPRARKVPGVILWGSTQAGAAGYPDNINISKGLECQPCFRENPSISRMDRGPCINPPRPSYDDETPHACMAAISVDEVVQAARELWERTG